MVQQGKFRAGHGETTSSTYISTAPKYTTARDCTESCDKLAQMRSVVWFGPPPKCYQRDTLPSFGCVPECPNKTYVQIVTDTP